jgi:hypothetical protein
MSKKREWSIIQREDGRQGIFSHDFTHDVELILDGDFKDANESFEYALRLAEKLNAPSEAEERDAARYRWLRSHFQYGPYEQHRLEWYLPRSRGPLSEQLDNAIDASLDRSKEK